MLGDEEALSAMDGDGLALGVTVGEAEPASSGEGSGEGDFFAAGLRFLRGFGVGPAKNFLSLSPKVSSSAPRTNPPLAIAHVIMTRKSERSFILDRHLLFRSGGQFFEHSFIHSNAGVEVLQGKVFIG